MNVKPRYCQYCGAPLEDRCDCQREASEYEEELMEERENRPETQLGYMQEDLIYLHNTER